ncbi:hypothetical protein [Mycolicibacterium sp.]
MIEIESPGGETFTLPPTPESFSPDYLATWTVDGQEHDPYPYCPPT